MRDAQTRPGDPESDGLLGRGIRSQRVPVNAVSVTSCAKGKWLDARMLRLKIR